MSPEHATIEYDLGARDDTPAAILLALDCSVRADELAHLERVVTEWLQGVSPDTPVGLVTYGEAVEVHELGCASRHRIWHLPHDVAELSLSDFKGLLGFPEDLDTASANAAPDDAAGSADHLPYGAPGYLNAPGPQGHFGLQRPPQGYASGPQHPGLPGAGAPGFMGGPPGYGPPLGGALGGIPGHPGHSYPSGGLGMPYRPEQSWQGIDQPKQGGSQSAAAAAAVEDLRGNAARFFVPAGEFDLSSALKARASAYSARKAVAPPPSPPSEQHEPRSNAGEYGAFSAYGSGAPNSYGAGGWPGSVPMGPRPGSIAARAAAAAAAEAEEVAEAEAAAGEPRKRAGRCTGSALSAAVSLLASCQTDGAARLVVFCGGPSVGGSGAIVEADHGSSVRSHTELQAGSQRAKAAAAYYDCLAQTAASRGHGIDVVSASLDETGLYEMRALMQRTGGVALQAESFEDETLVKSLERLYGTDGDSDAAMGFGSKIELIAGRDCAAVQHVGGGASVGAITDGTSKGDDSSDISVKECGGARSFSWNAGCLSPHTCIGLTLTPAKPSSNAADMAVMRDSQLLQLSATYSTAGGRRVRRVTTLRLPRLQRSWDAKQLLPALDQKAVGALLVRQAVAKADGGASGPEMLKWIDRLLIKMMRTLCTYAKGDPGSVMLPREAGILPGLVFHLRRSAVLRTSGSSPDRTCFFRLLASTLDTFSSLVMVQPTLIGYQPGGGSGRPLPLEPPSILPDRVLLLDSFTQLVICKGAALALAARSPGSPAAAEVEQLARRVRSDAEALGAERFPAPTLIECDQGSSKARYLAQKVNPDVPLSTFLQGLYRAIAE